MRTSGEKWAAEWMSHLHGRSGSSPDLWDLTWKLQRPIDGVTGQSIECRRSATGSSHYAADGAHHTLRTDSSRCGEDGGSQRQTDGKTGGQFQALDAPGPSGPSEGLVHFGDATSPAPHPHPPLQIHKLELQTHR
ncbi:unnamed protein product [Pleuronectes platessa]|uniref:Uncharacterized protein n=1 Tax=Pleuronectes platessa TaxID=8262 RepID=A0A9N7Y2E8_PLEPL|nr:unnamed protein product [Pleuronectes platessa]